MGYGGSRVVVDGLQQEVGSDECVCNWAFEVEDACSCRRPGAAVPSSSSCLIK